MDIVVTVPKDRWAEWLAEGDLATGGSVPAPWEEQNQYGFIIGSRPGTLTPGERLYVVAHGRLRGYAPVVAIEEGAVRFGGRPDQFAVVRQGGAVACTVRATVRGFQGWRYRWWPREIEVPFPDWRTHGVR